MYNNLSELAAHQKKTMIQIIYVPNKNIFFFVGDEVM